MSSARSPRSPGEPSMTDFSASHLDVEGTGVDGSGAVAIKMIHTDSTWTIIADVIRLVFSICLLIFSTIMTLYAIATSTTTMPGTIPPWAQYLLLGIALMVLGVLEGLQIGVVELAHKDPNRYRKLYPRAARLLAFENKGRNVERFLMGRQVLVVGTVFIAARITTFDGVWDAIHGLTFSGFLGVVLVVIVAQLTPQVLAAAYPTEFMNLPGMKIAFWACLLVEATGLVHAVWFLCVVVKKGCYKCVCAVSDDDDDVKFDRVASKSAMRGLKRHRDDDDDEDDDDDDDENDDEEVDIRVTNDMLKAAEKAEVGINEEAQTAKGGERNAVDGKRSKSAMRGLKRHRDDDDDEDDDDDDDENDDEEVDIRVTNDMLKAAEKAEVGINEEAQTAQRRREERSRWKTEYMAQNDDMDDQMNSLIEDVGNNRDLFYIYGDKKYLSPAQCHDKFKAAGLTPPQFLLPPDNPNHIPPHIVAMTLLKMYTENEKQNFNDK
eukprot:CAMPEP_0197072360 /NCGR_PEP_ID=MMETSP1384-20130603/210058_1 /TAXON_ID=29189 /ORGANISM="Ammonia sp." /LENGTH=491 /DNA_ID=CAMNT_0042511177 /DNA_START=229 /DNA_END=1705 /DNA_ORIENTATION=+